MPRENLVEIANFAAGIRDAASFEPSSGGASRMLNYIVDADGEIVPRSGYRVSDDPMDPEIQLEYLLNGAIYRIVGDIEIPVDGPIVATENSMGIRRLFRLDRGTNYVIDKDRLFVSGSDRGHDPYWVDLSGEGYVTDDNIFRWNQARPGGPGRDIDVETVNTLSGNTYTVTTNAEGSPYITVVINVVVRDRFTVNIRRRAIVRRTQRDSLEVRNLIINTPLDSTILEPGQHAFSWTGEIAQPAGFGRLQTTENFSGPGYYWLDDDIADEDAGFQPGNNLLNFFADIDSNNSSVQSGISHPTFVGLSALPPNPDAPLEIHIKFGQTIVDDILEVAFKQDDFAGDTQFWKKRYAITDDWANRAIEFFWRGEDDRDSETLRYISQEQFDETYFEVVYGNTKRRYYLAGHREPDISGGIGASVQAGLQIATVGAHTGPAAPYVAGAGAAIAVAGIAGTLINRAREGERVKIPRARTQLTPADFERGESGFYTGPIMICFTFSDTKELNIETLPSKTKSIIIFDFEELRNGQRVNEGVDIELPSASGVYRFARYLNIYATRSLELFDDGELPQSTGLEFQLIGQVRRDWDSDNEVWQWNPNDIHLGTDDQGITTYHWRNEELIERNREIVEDKYLESMDNDPPPLGLRNIVSYGSRMWGVNERENSIVYSKLAPHGFHAFPFDNALVPQSITLDNNNSKIIRIFPAPNDSLLYVFKRDTIHFIRGHGEVRGLHAPETPVDISIDASIKKENIGTYSPRSVATLKDSVLFLGSDKVLYHISGLNITPFSISIQPHIEKYTDVELEDVIAFEYRNQYVLCLPNEALVLDLQKKYWTIFDWRLKDVFWAQNTGHEDSNNKLYAINSDNELVELYYGDTDDGDNIVCEWESNPAKVPYQSVISGIHVYHDGSEPGELTVGLKINNAGEYDDSTYTPDESNRFRAGFHGRGHRVQVRVRDENANKLRIDRIALETTQ